MVEVRDQLLWERAELLHLAVVGGEVLSLLGDLLPPIGLALVQDKLLRLLHGVVSFGGKEDFRLGLLDCLDSQYLVNTRNSIYNKVQV